MVVSKTIDGDWFSLTGTIAEVMTALEAEKVPEHKLINAFYNGTNITAIYHK
jgi:hypothetical protein